MQINRSIWTHAANGARGYGPLDSPVLENLLGEFAPAHLASGEPLISNILLACRDTTYPQPVPRLSHRTMASAGREDTQADNHLRRVSVLYNSKPYSCKAQCWNSWKRMRTSMIRLFFAGPLRNVDYNGYKEKRVMVCGGLRRYRSTRFNPAKHDEYSDIYTTAAATGTLRVSERSWLNYRDSPLRTGWGSVCRLRM